eukprot:TRINITY_DN1925_c0_g4_i1.p1 TRINITY_DN1925_c0_g4~~TRINITY_DN1925_c0_g4_i1.p1  ORF type:complete len:141 (+),score=28.62 TRINITY_DN1925_c0_g4_i1:151-573(+)
MTLFLKLVGMQFLAVLGSRRGEQGDLAVLGSSVASEEQTCDMVSGAVKRQGWHIGSNCKCEKQDSILNEKCGSQSGQRTWSLDVLHQDVRGLWNLKASGCACVTPSQDAAGGSQGGDAEEHTSKPAKEQLNAADKDMKPI